MVEKMTAFPADDAPLADWLRPISATLTPGRCLEDNRGRQDVDNEEAQTETPEPAEEMTDRDRERIMRACHRSRKTLDQTAMLIGKSRDQTQFLAARFGLKPWPRYPGGRR